MCVYIFIYLRYIYIYKQPFSLCSTYFYVEDHHLPFEAVSSASKSLTDSQLLQAKLQEALPVQLFLGCNDAFKTKHVSHYIPL